MLRSCDSVSSRRAFSRCVIQLNTSGCDDDDLQAEQTTKGKQDASHIWMDELILTFL